MKAFDFKKILPTLAAIAIFVGLTFTYFSPMLKGKVIRQGDMVSNVGMSKEVNDHREQYGEEPIWTNSMFGGMPSYLFSIRYSHGTLIPHVRTLLTLGMKSPAMILFSYMLGFFILLRVLGVNAWLSIVGSVAFAFTSYTLIIIEAGHLTKSMAISYMAPSFAGVLLICRKRYLIGTAVLSLYAALEMVSSHVQITYYLIIICAIYVLFEYVKFVKNKEYDAIWKSLVSFIVAAVFGFFCNSSTLLNTMDYVKYSIRGESELSDDKDDKTSGLDRSYAVGWSLGKAETMSLMIPGFKGRSSALRIGESKSALKEVDAPMRSYIGNFPQYWGEQPFTSACYAGAIVVFLFVLGLFILEGNLKWALLVVTVLSILLAWGRHFMGLTNFFLDYVPGYNKFRAVSMILIIAEFTIPLLAILAVNKLITTKNALQQKVKLAIVNSEVSIQNSIIISFLLTGGLSLIFYLMPDLTDFDALSDAQTHAQVAQSNGIEVANSFMQNVELARMSLFKSDAIRSFLFISVAVVLLFMFLKSIINQITFIALLGIFVLTDLWLVDRKFLNKDNFVTKYEAINPFPETVADKAILRDADPNYRVLNLSVNTFNDASTSYRHKSIGGYSAVKLRRYQDLIEKHISGEIRALNNTFQKQPSPESISATLANSKVLNMLNTRYIIYNKDAAPLVNNAALGNVWFVNAIKIVKNADEEIASLHGINPASSAVVDERFAESLSGFSPSIDSQAFISLSSYKANHLTYTSSTISEQLAVFSEVYYEDGWNTYIDGKFVPHVRANYVLRAMRIPAGKHTIEFKFEPPHFESRQYISLGTSIALFAFLGFSIFKTFKEEKA